MISSQTPARNYTPGMGDAVADRTINRKIAREIPRRIERMTVPRRDDISLDSEVNSYCKSKGLVYDGYDVKHGDGNEVVLEVGVTAEMETEKWADVAHRVSFGNASLEPRKPAYATGGMIYNGKTLNSLQVHEYDKLNHHLRQASLLMSGRHLQHGDENQSSRNMEVFTNCSTAAVTFLSFYLLLNGSGVGRSYDNAMQAVDLANLPIVVPVIDMGHADSMTGEIKALTRRDAEHLYAGRKIIYFEVPDSREGWAKAIEQMEVLAYFGNDRDSVLILDFSKVRPRGAPIGGMQGRPASGPGPLMEAIGKIAKLRDAGMAPWRSALYADHYAAECVLVGGARRAARMATKDWRDHDVLDFVEVKRGGFLWSSNNSVTVDQDFWNFVQTDRENAPTDPAQYELWMHANKVFDGICYAAYHDQTGEPGIITVDRLTWKKDDSEEGMLDGKFAESERYKLDSLSEGLMRALARAWQGSRYKVITNPCGEIVLSMLGAYCTIADVVPFHAQGDDDAEDAFRTATRALIRVNTMDSLYNREVKRTNRIGVGMTGLHEYAFDRFGIGWKEMVSLNKQGIRSLAKMAAEKVGTASKDIVDWLEAHGYKSAAFWLTLARFKRAVQQEAAEYSLELGVVAPHTDTTMKPAGTTSKLFGLTEGAHLPSMREYLRWVQFRNGDPLIEEYRAKGYPVRELKIYSGTTIVGFPTQPTICTLGMGDKLITAAEATPEEQYEYLRLLEAFWITGVSEDGQTDLAETGNQVSYTLKYSPGVVSYEDFKRTLRDGQSTIRCCSVMPQTDTSAYEYTPEEMVTKGQYEAITNAIRGAVKEDIGLEHVDCGTGGCPISFGENEVSEEKAAA
jgi:adenosylcobalamin-dependent ribonucleoside-triphosphate reductase